MISLKRIPSLIISMFIQVIVVSTGFSQSLPDITVHESKYGDAGLSDIAMDSNKTIVLAYVLDDDILVVKSSKDRGVTWLEIFNDSLGFDSIDSISIDIVENDPNAPSPNMVFIGIALRNGSPGVVEEVGLISGSYDQKWQNPQIVYSDISANLTWGHVNTTGMPEVELQTIVWKYVNGKNVVTTSVVYPVFRHRGGNHAFDIYEELFLITSLDYGQSLNPSIIIDVPISKLLSKYNKVGPIWRVLRNPALAYNKDLDKIIVAVEEYNGKIIQVMESNAHYVAKNDPYFFKMLFSTEGQISDPVSHPELATSGIWTPMTFLKKTQNNPPYQELSWMSLDTTGAGNHQYLPALSMHAGSAGDITLIEGKAIITAYAQADNNSMGIILFEGSYDPNMPSSITQTMINNKPVFIAEPRIDSIANTNSYATCWATGKAGASDLFVQINTN